MRRLASGPGSVVMLAAAVVVAFLLAACSHGGEHEARAIDCLGSRGGPKKIVGTPKQSDIPTNWGDTSAVVPLGQNKVRLRMTAVANVSEFSTACLNDSTSYIVAKIEYADPHDTTTVAEWPSWTDHTKPVYLDITRGTGKGDFDYVILVPVGSVALQATDTKPRHGFSFNDPHASAGKDGITWGIPPEHVNDTTYQRKYKDASGSLPPAPPTQDGSRIHQSLDSTSKLDPLQAGWFGCSQGCCTATNLI